MKTIVISNATYWAIADIAILPFRSTAAKQPDGTWLVPVSDEVWHRLEDHRLAGESDDDLVQRFIRSHRGQRPN